MSTIDESSSSSTSRVVNINIGVLGHVDSGKTSLVKALSSSLSTAALDKNPQSQERGITLDLGFSSFKLPIPEHLQPCLFDQIQFTLVDCPGHASLIRTIIGGAQIIDMIILVIDANKGIQTQTAECIVISEITTEKLIIVLNKIDMIPESERSAKLERISDRMRKYFASTKFSNVQIVYTAASVGGEKVASISSIAVSSSTTTTTTTTTAPSSTGADTVESVKGILLGTYANTSAFGVNDLVRVIQNNVSLPNRQVKAPFYYAIDHCFAIKGHGTVLTGTVLNGSISVNQIIEIPHIQSQRKVKSMQMFHKSVKYAQQGDRVGLCVTNLDPKLVERGIAAAPESLHQLTNVICMVKKIRFFKLGCKSGSKFHISVGHSTVLASVVFFGATELASALGTSSTLLDQLTLADQERKPVSTSGGTSSGSSSAKVGSATVGSATVASSSESTPALCGAYLQGFPTIQFDPTESFLTQSELVGSSDLRYGHEPCQWALVQFEQSVFCPLGSLVIGSKLDIDTTTHGQNRSGTGADTNDSARQCRLAFFGPIRQAMSDEDIAKLRIYTWRSKEGSVFKLIDVRLGLCYELIGQNMFTDVAGVHAFQGMRVQVESMREGIIMGPFGSDGKFKVKFEVGTRVTVGSKLTVRFKRYTYDRTKVMHQSSISESAHLPPEEPNTDPEPDKNSNRNKNKKQSQSDHIPTNDFSSNSTSSSIVPEEGKVLLKSVPVQASTAVAVAVASPSVAFPAVAAASVSKIDIGSERRGVIDSLKSETSTDGATQVIAIIKDAFRMEENIRTYIGCKVIPEIYCCTSSAQAHTGELIGPYAKMGKCKVKFPADFQGAVGDSVVIFLTESKS